MEGLINEKEWRTNFIGCRTITGEGPQIKQGVVHVSGSALVLLLPH